MQPRVVVTDAATRIEGPLLFLRRTLDVGLNEAVEVRGGNGRVRLGRVAALDETHLTIELLESSAGLGLQDTAVPFLGEPIHPPAVDWHEPIRRNILGDTTERRLISAREHVRDGPLK